MDVRYLWSKIKKLRTKRTNSFPTISFDGHFISYPQQIANGFANYWSSLSSNNSFEAEIITSKNNFEIGDLCPSGSNFMEMAYDINLIELNEVLRTLKSSTPAINKITYAIIKSSPPEVKIELYNSPSMEDGYTNTNSEAK